MTITLATLLGLFSTGLSPIGLLGGVITLIVGVNFWMEDREALVLPTAARESTKNRFDPQLPILPSTNPPI